MGYHVTPQLLTLYQTPPYCSRTFTQQFHKYQQSFLYKDICFTARVILHRNILEIFSR
jgi:hypothetical protein